jgi:hypothetical protein
MNLTSHKTSLIILVITALVSSRTFFALVNDPEGPNLLIVVVLAAILLGVSLGLLRLLGHSLKGGKRLLFGIAAQVVLAAGLYWMA